MADQISGLLSPWLREQRIAAALPHLRGRVLDYGCGVGALGLRWDRGRYVGVDIDDASLAEAKRRLPEVPLLRGLEESCARLEALGPFDTVVGLAVIEHVPDVEGVLRRLRDLLCKGGQIVLTTPHPAFEWIHAAGAAVRLFSREADEEHETLLNRRTMTAHAQAAGLQLLHFHRFLLGANQLFILG